MELLIYIIRLFLMLMVTWLALRIIGKKSIAQLTSFELAGIILITNVAAEPLVFKISSKATIGVIFIALFILLIGDLSLRKRFYNVDMRPDILMQYGKINKDVLKKNKMNVYFFISMLRLKGYARVSDVEFAILEPNGQISVIPKSANRALTPADMQITPQYEGLPLPVILEGEIQYNNLKFVNLNAEWLMTELSKASIDSADQVFLAQLDAQNKLYLCRYDETQSNKPPIE